jgi:hypothetical protein
LKAPRLVVAGIMAMLLVAPPASAQGLDQALADLQFDLVTFTVGPSAVEIRAEDLVLQGTAASEFRSCLDGGDQCPNGQFRQISPGNDDGTVTQTEVDQFRDLVLNLWFGVPEFKEFGDALKAIVTVDGRPADVINLRAFDVSGAAGPVGSRDSIDIDILMESEYRSTQDGDRHAIVMHRTESQLEITRRIVVQAAGGWQIDGGTVEPAGMATLLDDGRFQGTQSQFEGSEPMAFDINESSSGIWLWIALGALLVAGGIIGFIVWQRSRKP